MKSRAIVTFLLCFSLICLSLGFASSAYANLDSDRDTETNVITESDARGGDISGKQLVAIIFITLMVTVIVIVAIVAG